MEGEAGRAAAAGNRPGRRGGCGGSPPQNTVCPAGSRASRFRGVRVEGRGALSARAASRTGVRVGAFLVYIAPGKKCGRARAGFSRVQSVQVAPYLTQINRKSAQERADLSKSAPLDVVVPERAATKCRGFLDISRQIRPNCPHKYPVASALVSALVLGFGRRAPSALKDAQALHRPQFERMVADDHFFV